MNAIIKSLQEIKFTIPPEVLQIGFVENFNRTNIITSLDERIKNSVIRARVLVDANMLGGVPIRIPLPRCKYYEVGNREWVVEIPKELTSNRSIVAVQSLVSNSSYITQIPLYNTTSVITQANHMMNSLGSERIIQTARLELIGDNVVLVQDPAITIFNATIRANIEYDEMMNNLHPRYIPVFAKACVLATKAYIYNNCTVKLDQGYVYAGHELGTPGEIINGYSDAEEQYQEHIYNVLGKVLFMNDSNRSGRYIASMLGNTL